MKPYYDHAGITIYHGDARDPEFSLKVLRDASLITDPVWPDCEHIFPGINAPQLLLEVLQSFIALPRLAIHLGCNSDPRYLLAVPRDFTFFRTAHLEVVAVGKQGRLLRTGDTAYLFGVPPGSRLGARVIPGRMIDSSSASSKNGHPCPRRLAHAAWLVKWWSEPGGMVVDPFCGSGTTLEAAKLHGRKGVGIDIEERWCEIAAKRLSQEVFSFEEVNQ